ncbi:hypothetical protein AALB51_08525 [Lachnospiraceae bacterium 62-26]
MNDKIIMDTNVAVKAAIPKLDCKDEELHVRSKCVEFIGRFVKNPKSKLVLDLDYEIIKEYRNRIPTNTDMGKVFWRWFNTYIGQISFDDLVKLDKRADGNYDKFPLEERTEKFDMSDRKFIALAIVHEEHPPIVEAMDGKWLGFKDVFEEYGVHIEFLDMDYAAMMLDRKSVNKRSS